MSRHDERQGRLSFGPEPGEAESAPRSEAPQGADEDRGPRRFAGARMPRGRLTFVVVCLGFWTVVIGARLVQLQVVDGDHYRERAAAQQHQQVKLESPRGTIYDREGRELAVSVDARSVSLHPFDIEDVDAAASSLAPLAGANRPALAKKIHEARAQGKRFIWLNRRLSPEAVDKIAALDLKGVGFLQESRRFYPHGELAASTLGFVGMDADGLWGVEANYDEAIRGRKVVRHVMVDSHRNTVVVPSALDQTPRPGADLHLTLDASLQHIVESELERRVKWAGAKAGAVIILDPRDSAVLAMASYPGFDPVNFGNVPQKLWRNRVISEAFEPGSTFKMITAAAAIEGGVVHPDDRFDCGNGGIRLDSRTYIRDHKAFDVLSFREIIAKSSNVGVIRIALETGTESLFEMTHRFGFGQRTGIDLHGEHSGQVHGIERWKNNWGMAYVSFGHFLTVTPMQVANAYAAVANGGTLHQPYVVRAVDRDGQLEPVERPEGKRVLSRATSLELIRLLEGVVETGGSATRASIDGYRVAGKTGTAQKSTSKGYDLTGRMASFVGIAPSRNPRLVAMVVLDEPSISPNGGVVAAPTFKAIVSKALLHMGVSAETHDDLGTQLAEEADSEPRAQAPIRLAKSRGSASNQTAGGLH